MLTEVSLCLNSFKHANNTWLKIQVFEYEADFSAVAAADLDVRQAQGGNELGYYFMERLLQIFSSLIKKWLLE